MIENKTGTRSSLGKTTSQLLKRFKSQDVYNIVGRKSTLTNNQSNSNKNFKYIPEKKEISLMSPSKKTKTKIINQNNKQISKILNDESIQELDTEENNNGSLLDENETKSSNKYENLNNSVGEGLNNIKNPIINNLPKPFVKQNTKNITDEIKNNIEVEQRKLLTAAKRGDREVFLQTLEIILNDENGDINFKDESGWTALHYSCDEGNLKIVDILIKANVDINTKTNNKKTPLHIAVSHGYFDITKLLIENGCSINSTDDEKNTVMHICASMSHIELLKYLLEKCPDSNSKNIYGQTPITIAKKENIKNILKDFNKKISNQFQKIHIHTTNDQSANHLLRKGNNLNDTKELNKTGFNKRQSSKIKSPDVKPFTHNKFQSNDFNMKTTAFQDNNIKINITTNIGNSKVKIKEKLKVTVETKVGKINNTNIMSYDKKVLNTTPTYSSNYDKNKFKPSKTSTQMLSTTLNSVSSGDLKFNNPNKITPSVKHVKSEKEFRKNSKINGNNFLNSKKLDENSSDRTNTSNNLNTVHIDLTDVKPPLYEIEESNNYLSEDIIDEQIGPSSFQCLALLGKGSFGEVYLVQKNNTGMLYAMKVLSKDKVTGQNLVKYAMTERNVLSIMNHPFIVKLNYAFQTNDKLFLILDYCPGGDLAEHLAKEKRFKEERAKLYICEIILALEDLHKRDIIFRDLKPDNVVLDLDGHALLTDFGLSKEGVLDSRSAKSFCGSIAYLAPEMLKRTGHGKAVDWYLLGVLFYEMLVGIPPYFANNKEQIFKNIDKGELQIPKFVSQDAQNLLNTLLQKDPSMRLGTQNDADEIKSHEYFKDVNWDNIYNKNTNPPIPTIQKKVLQQFLQPRTFEESEENYDSHFDGWSFINNDDRANKSNQV